ncbi:MAG: hypothetical protein ACYCT2_09540 [Thermoplasmataceae archaeon]
MQRRSINMEGGYAQIAEKYREDGKQKTTVIKHIDPVKNEADRERYRSIFQQELRKAKLSVAYRLIQQEEGGT